MNTKPIAAVLAGTLCLCGAVWLQVPALAAPALLTGMSKATSSAAEPPQLPADSAGEATVFQAETAILRADGRTKTLSVTDLLTGAEDLSLPSRMSVGELSVSTASRFSALPRTEGYEVSFALRPSSSAYEVEIPLIFKDDGGSAAGELTLHIQAQPVSEVTFRTQSQVRRFYRDSDISTSASDRFDTRPDVEEDIPGELEDRAIERALDALNFVRYTAGISHEVANSDTYETYAQAGAALLEETGRLDRTPPRVSGMSDAFYQNACEGTALSNLSRGYSNLADSILSCWMDDDGDSDTERAVSRRWCLDPSMKHTGFGRAGRYSVMYVSDSLNQPDACPYDYIPWPAQTMPLDFFDGAWTVSLNPEVYQVPDVKDLRVVLTSDRRDRSYTLTSGDTDPSEEYLYYDADAVGGLPALIFDPDVSFSSGDDVTVSITGLTDRYGNDLPIEYTVHFFRLRSSGSSSSGSSSGGGSSSGSSSRGPSSAGTSAGPGSPASVPSYVVYGSWSTTAEGTWRFTDNNGTLYVNTWAAVYNPYANPALGQSMYDWFRFDASGNMLTGWFTDVDGSRYYLNPASDGTRGRMFTGWAWIPNEQNVLVCYYFNPVSDGYRGRLITNAAVDGYTVDAQGRWTVNGTVQTR